MESNNCIHCPDKPIKKEDGIPLYVCLKVKIACPNKIKHCEWYKDKTNI